MDDPKLFKKHIVKPGPPPFVPTVKPKVKKTFPARWRANREH